MESRLVKGVYQGQSRTEPHASHSVQARFSDGMTHLMKGVFRSQVEQTDSLDCSPPKPGSNDHFTLRPLTPSDEDCQMPLAVPQFEQQQPSQTKKSDVDHGSSLTNEPRVGKKCDVSLLNGRSIKITLEEPSTSSASSTKKPELHPQVKLDQFWNVFEPEYLGKITRILPTSLIESSPATSKQAGDRSHCAGRSYEDARARCIRDVKRIVRECRTHNKRYTDTHFDIERDLKITRRRDCLDGLYSTTTSTNNAASRTNPTDVKRVYEIFDTPTFFSSAASFDDIIQGNLGDCWLLAAFSILTCNRRLVQDICVIQDADVGVYGFVFYRDGDWHQTIVDDKLYLRAPAYDESGDVILTSYGVVQRDQERSYNELFQRGSKSLYFAQCRDENETWVPLLEKALAKSHGSYAALIGGQTGEAIEDLTGGVTTEIYTTNILNKEKFWYDELRKIGTDFVFSAAAATYREWRAPQNSSTRQERRQGIVSQHAYAILDTYEGYGQRLVKMRNPWGSSEWTGPWSDGSKEWNHEWIERLNHKFGDDGIFWISYEDMLKKYKYLDRTRIFGPGWHIAQQWTSVQVPWNTTDYQQTRFQIDVPEDTEAVIVLSQLDDRYFQGLQGKYDYTLQFRIQKDDETDDEDDGDYFARSAHNYELVRSNNVEVPVEKGRYTVLFKVEARKTNRKDVEAVIRENIWRKEKLMQIGTLYDLAHQKGRQNLPSEKAKTMVSGGGGALATGAKEDGEESDESARKQTNEEKDKDPNRDPWNAFCVVGLRVYSKQENMGLRVLHLEEDEEPAPPVLDRDDIANAPLQEAQQNSEQTPAGSVAGEGEQTGSETSVEDPSGEIAVVDGGGENPAEQRPQPDTPIEAKPEDAAKPEDTATTPADDTRADEEAIETSQVMDDLSGDRNCIKKSG